MQQNYQLDVEAELSPNRSSAQWTFKEVLVKRTIWRSGRGRGRKVKASKVCYQRHFRVAADDGWIGSYKCYRSDNVYFEITAVIDSLWVRFETWSWAVGPDSGLADPLPDEVKMRMLQDEPGPSTSSDVTRPAKRKFPEDSAETPQSSGEEPAKRLKVVQTLFKLDEKAPTTRVRIAVPTGQLLTARFNHYHTVADVRHFIVAAIPRKNNSYRRRLFIAFARSKEPKRLFKNTFFSCSGSTFLTNAGECLHHCTPCMRMP